MDDRPIFRRQVVGLYRTRRWARFLESIFGGLAKAMLGFAALVLFAFAVLGGDPSGITDLPSTRRQLKYFMLFLLLVVAGICVSICFWRPPAMASAHS